MGSLLDHLGAYAQTKPVDEICALTQHVWDDYHESAGGPVRSETQRQFFCSRMMYISEAMSRSVRINASWAMTHPAMSLLRDRYEQTVRFSWLAKQSDGKEFSKYLLHYYAKTRSLMRNISSETRKKYEELMGPFPSWVTEKITKEQDAKLRQWESVTLRELAKRRDALPPLNGSQVAKEQLSNWYDPIYGQFSSVSHFDFFSVQMISLHNAPNGTLVMAAEPHWPGLLMVQNCLFDIVQCFEAAHCYHKKVDADGFDKFLAKWAEISSRMGLGAEQLAKK